MTTELFADLPAPIRDALIQRGFEGLTTVQQAVVSARSEGRDLRISSQTGSGKTIAIGIALAEDFLQADRPGAALQADRPGGAVQADRHGGAVQAAGPGAAPVKPAGSGGAQGAEGETDGADEAAPAKPKVKGPRGPKAERGFKRTADGAAHPIAIVIVPTRELAAQVSEELGWLYAKMPKLGVEVVTGGTSVMMERRALSRGPALVVGTPGRLLDHLQNDAIKCDRIAHVVLDEADQMLDMGFREELEAILDHLPESRSSHLVSATFPRGVLELANRYQKDALVIEGTRLGVANADIQHIAYGIKRHETYPALVNILLAAGDERCLLFVNRRVDATELAEKLAADGFGAAPFSGELAQAQRTRTLAAFRNGTLPILVSTDVAARGIDVPGISTVIHVDPPREANSYTHRSGRTGRAGQAGRSILLVTPQELGRVQRTTRYAKVELSWQPVPTPERVAKILRKRARRALHEQLAEHEPGETQMMYAKSLLEERDPVQVVATLLDLTAAEAACEPMKVMGFDPSKQGKGRSQGRDRDDRGRHDRRPGHAPGRPEGRDAGYKSNGSPIRPDPDKFTRFFVSWGRESGATTGRLLSQVCRRGGIESDQVGAIEVAARVSFVAVANEVAADFESRARKPDSRDPGIVIKRAEERGEHAASRPRPSGPGGFDPGRNRGPAHSARAGRTGHRPDWRDRQDEAGHAVRPSGPRNAGSGPPSGPSASRGHGGPGGYGPAGGGPRGPGSGRGPGARTQDRGEGTNGKRGPKGDRKVFRGKRPGRSPKH